MRARRDRLEAIEVLFDGGVLASLRDDELLACFHDRKGAVGQEAFRILVDRHGPMVLGVCRSITRDVNDADDAFQATFLLLVRKAGSIKRRDTIGPWLRGAAGFVARRARERAIRQQRREIGSDEALRRALQPVRPVSTGVDDILAEIDELSERLRAPVVSCCLEGLSYEEAARRLNISEPTLRGRLHRARKRIAQGLTRRASARGTFALTRESSFLGTVRVPSDLVTRTVESVGKCFSDAVTAATTSPSAPVVVPETVVELTRGVCQTMLIQSLKTSVVLVSATVAALGVLALSQHGKASAGANGTTNIARDVEPAQKKPEQRGEPERGR